ncbi:MAG TPA: YCF48-related protein, partial [Vicinamibacterales bacterium]|nr:YCF48-related protein [Vicinamibacterales bacterium]
PPAASAGATANAPAQPARPLERRQTNPALERNEAAKKERAAAPSRADSKPLTSTEALKDAGALAPPAAANAAPPSVTDQAKAPRAASPLMKTDVRALAARAMPVIVSPNPASQWRVVDGGAVQRTTDGGATWETQQTGVTEAVAAGASPSALVCWLAGPHGIVLLSVDGRTWRRVAFPEDVPLVTVTAADARNATVTTTDGKTFVTTDAGETWSRPR